MSRRPSKYLELKKRLHHELEEKLDLSRVSDLAGDILRHELALVVERLCDKAEPGLDRLTRDRLVHDILDLVLPHSDSQLRDDQLPGEGDILPFQK